MFSQIWKRYLPVIALLIKRTGTTEQTLTLNHTDFERAAGGRKIKYSFSHLQLNKGRINNEVKHSVIAKEFATVLQEDEALARLLSNVRLEFSLNNQLVLTIRNTEPQDAAVSETDTPAEAELTATDPATEEAASPLQN